MAPGRNSLAEIFAVMRDPSLSVTARVVWAILRSYDGGRGAWPSDRTVAEQLGKHEKTVRNARRELMTRGFLIQQKRGPRPAMYRAVLPSPLPDAAPPAEGRDVEGRNDDSADDWQF